MTPQTTIKLPGSELPYGALNDWRFWLLLLAISAMIWLWRKK